MSSFFNRISFLQGFLALSILWVVLALLLEKPSVDVPDFKSMTSVQEKKASFFEFFGQMVDAENQRVEALREELKNNPSQTVLEKRAKRYRIEISDPATEKDIAALMKKVDILPASLVLSQAAIESAWGTSRFATEGYNYFGQWCFSKGCGMVPASRNEGASHEVQVFDSPQEAVRAYFRNLNSHPTYKKLRDLRANARAQNKPIHGCVLAAGLSSYSERGQHYIDEIRQMIRVNDLTPHGEGPCSASEKPKVAEQTEAS